MGSRIPRWKPGLHASTSWPGAGWGRRESLCLSFQQDMPKQTKAKSADSARERGGAQLQPGPSHSGPHL